MENLDRVITALLDERLATLDMKKELAELLGIQVNQIELVELLQDECCIHECIAICFTPSVVLEKVHLQKLKYEYITVDTEGRLILVLSDELMNGG